MSINNQKLVPDSGSDDSGIDSAAPEAKIGQAPQEDFNLKKKDGRKPIYAILEENRERNRQAQTAFRERRTKYVEQLERTVKDHATKLHDLQTLHRSTIDEYVMLRYKNSLLERILLEKEIDVQAELCTKTGSPRLGSRHMPQNMAQSPKFDFRIQYQQQSLSSTRVGNSSESKTYNIDSAEATSDATYYLNIQKHIEQLEQEYDMQADIVSDQDSPQSFGPGPYPEPLPQDALGQQFLTAGFQSIWRQRGAEI